MQDSGDNTKDGTLLSCPAHYEGAGFSMDDCPACAPYPEGCECWCWCTSYRYAFGRCWQCLYYCEQIGMYMGEI